MESCWPAILDRVCHRPRWTNCVGVKVLTTLSHACDLPQISEPVAMRVGLDKICCAAGSQAHHLPERKQDSGLRTGAGSDTPGNGVAGGGCCPPATEVSDAGQPTTSQTLPSPETHRGIECGSSPRNFPDKIRSRAGMSRPGGNRRDLLTVTYMARMISSLAPHMWQQLV